MYTKEGFAEVLHQDGFEGSWLEWLLKETEVSHGTSSIFSHHSTPFMSTDEQLFDEYSQDPSLR